MATRSSRPSTRATSTSHSHTWPAARMSSRAIRANTRASPAASPLPATHCPPLLVKAAIPRWTSRTTRPGRSKGNNSQCSDNSKCGTGTDCEPGRQPGSRLAQARPRSLDLRATYYWRKQFTLLSAQAEEVALCRTRCVTAHRTREVGLHQATHKVD